MDSDSSDGPSPSTPQKKSGVSSNVLDTVRRRSASISSPVQLSSNSNASSPKRALFHRPAKINTRLDNGNDKHLASPTSPGHGYFFSSAHKALGEAIDLAHQQTSASAGSAFTNLLSKHKKDNISNTKANKSFDIIRDPPPMSPSFFSTSAGRSASIAATSYMSLDNNNDDIWALLQARVLPLFNGDGLRQPIEDLNRLVSLQIRKSILEKSQHHISTDVIELFETGMSSLENNLASLPNEKLLNRLVEIWTFFFCTILPYLEATFLPLSIEWSSNPSLYMPSTDGKSTMATTYSIHTIALTAYRDMIILPLFTRLQTLLSQGSFLHLNVGATASGTNESFSRILQCISVLRRVLSHDEKQAKMDELGKVVLFTKGAKAGRDRRGFVGSKQAVLE